MQWPISALGQKQTYAVHKFMPDWAKSVIRSPELEVDHSGRPPNGTQFRHFCHPCRKDGLLID
jgi:hypothetical protein